jgi:hypothetical protein
MSETLVAEMGSILSMAAASRRRQINEILIALSGKRVQSGPFAGMLLETETSWGDGDLSPKILGCYEAELHPAMDYITANPYDTVVNVGCAEGYYAIGLALKMPQAQVHAFDINAAAQEVCRKAARDNNAGNVTVHGACGPDQLSALLEPPGKAIVIMDCEGYERELLNPAKVRNLDRADVLVECHDCIDRAITGTLIEAFRETHALSLINEGARDPNAFEFLRGWSSLDRWLAINEGRPEMMRWLFMMSNALRTPPAFSG